MTAVFGAGNWLDRRYELHPANVIFVPANRFVFMEGGDQIATEMENYLIANITAIQNWVFAGGAQWNVIRFRWSESELPVPQPSRKCGHGSSYFYRALYPGRK
jgi:hypothetical protein